jgi:hypothetical protein
MSRRRPPEGITRPCLYLKGTPWHWMYAILRTSDRWGSSAKLIFEVVHELDRPIEGHPGKPGGCFLDDAAIGKKLGLSRDCVGNNRRAMVQAGILIQVGPEQRCRLFPFLPGDIWGKQPGPGLSPDQRQEWIELGVERLHRAMDTRQKEQECSETKPQD